MHSLICLSDRHAVAQRLCTAPVHSDNEVRISYTEDLFGQFAKICCHVA